MKRYVALLRGINIGGKNRIPMTDLKQSFEKLDFFDVVTYLNSGNIVFSCEDNDIQSITDKAEAMIKSSFNLEIPTFIIGQEELNEMLGHAPEWWGNADREIYDNIIFIMPHLSYERFSDEMGSPKAEFEKVCKYENAVFWSFDRKNYQKTNWWSKTATSGISGGITIRTANTVRKIACL